MASILASISRISFSLSSRVVGIAMGGFYIVRTWKAGSILDRTSSKIRSRREVVALARTMPNGKATEVVRCIVVVSYTPL